MKPAISLSAIVEQAIPLGLVPVAFEERTGVKPSMESVRRWILRGSGGIFLQSFMVGSRRYCRGSDIDAFQAAVNAKLKKRQSAWSKRK